MKKTIFCFGIIFMLMLSAFAQAKYTVQIADTMFSAFPAMRDYCISEQGDEDFFTIESLNGEIAQIASRRKTAGVWSAPVLMPFCDAFKYLEPFLSPDGNRLYFASNRPLNHADTLAKDFDIWFVMRTNPQEKWSEPIHVGTPVHSAYDEFYPCVTQQNNLYFTMDAPNGMGKDDIYFAAWNGNGYNAPQLCNAHINSSGYEFNAYIAPDETFMLFTKYGASDGFGSGDLYISERDTSGNWLPAQNLGAEINSRYMEYCPFYSRTEQTLYFTSRRSALRPQKFDGTEALRRYVTGAENGGSKIYKVAIDLK